MVVIITKLDNRTCLCISMLQPSLYALSNFFPSSDQFEVVACGLTRETPNLMVTHVVAR